MPAPDLSALPTADTARPSTGSSHTQPGAAVCGASGNVQSSTTCFSPPPKQAVSERVKALIPRIRVRAIFFSLKDLGFRMGLTLTNNMGSRQSLR